MLTSSMIPGHPQSQEPQGAQNTKWASFTCDAHDQLLPLPPKKTVETLCNTIFTVLQHNDKNVKGSLGLELAMSGRINVSTSIMATWQCWPIASIPVFAWQHGRSCLLHKCCQTSHCTKRKSKRNQKSHKHKPQLDRCDAADSIHSFDANMHPGLAHLRLKPRKRTTSSRVKNLDHQAGLPKHASFSRQSCRCWACDTAKKTSVTIKKAGPFQEASVVDSQFDCEETWGWSLFRRAQTTSHSCRLATEVYRHVGRLCGC